jgi:hypothetical protein
MPNPFEALLNAAGRNYQQADKVLGGWLPGGGTASPLTKTLFPPQPFPKRSEELKRITGIAGRFIDPEKTPSLVQRIAPSVSPMWGKQDYANPILNEIGMSNYTGGRIPSERKVEFHELGHLNPADKNIFSYAGVLGRSLQGFNEQIGKLPLIDVAAGLALQYGDAPEEDRAERFAKKYAEKGNYPSPVIYKDNTSDYGNILRREGRELTAEGLNKLADPFGIISKTSQFINTKRAEPIRKEMLQIEPELKRLFMTSGDQISPELLAISKRHHALEQQLELLNIPK